MLAVCPVCGGDGKETCTNPDHGIISALSFIEIGRLGCPCCGHNPLHKVPNGDNCEACCGFGAVSVDRAEELVQEYQL